MDEIAYLRSSVEELARVVRNWDFLSQVEKRNRGSRHELVKLLEERRKLLNEAERKQRGSGLVADVVKDSDYFVIKLTGRTFNGFLCKGWSDYPITFIATTLARDPSVMRFGDSGTARSLIPEVERFVSGIDRLANEGIRCTVEPVSVSGGSLDGFIKELYGDSVKDSIYTGSIDKDYWDPSKLYSAVHEQSGLVWSNEDSLETVLKMAQITSKAHGTMLVIENATKKILYTYYPNGYITVGDANSFVGSAGIAINDAIHFVIRVSGRGLNGFLSRSWKEYPSGSFATPSVNSDNVLVFSHKHMANKVVDVVNSFVRNHHSLSKDEVSLSVQEKSFPDGFRNVVNSLYEIGVSDAGKRKYKLTVEVGMQTHTKVVEANNQGDAYDMARDWGHSLSEGGKKYLGRFTATLVKDATFSQENLVKEIGKDFEKTSGKYVDKFLKQKEFSEYNGSASGLAQELKSKNLDVAMYKYLTMSDSLDGLRNAINFLIVDETEAIKGYDDVLRLDSLSVDDRAKLEKIRNEEISHITDLSDIYRGLAEGAIDTHVAEELFDSAYRSAKGVKVGDMIIDLILDRKDGQPYDPETFYREVTNYGSTGTEIARALDSGTNQDVINAINRYIDREGYSRDIKNWVRTKKWVFDSRRADSKSTVSDKKTLMDVREVNAQSLYKGSLIEGDEGEWWKIVSISRGNTDVSVSVVNTFTGEGDSWYFFNSDKVRVKDSNKIFRVVDKSGKSFIVRASDSVSAVEKAHDKNSK